MAYFSLVLHAGLKIMTNRRFFYLYILFNVPLFFIPRCLTLRCKLYFDNLLSQRAYCGKMNFDHKNETLSISVSVLTLCVLLIWRISCCISFDNTLISFNLLSLENKELTFKLRLVFARVLKIKLISQANAAIVHPPTQTATKKIARNFIFSDKCLPSFHSTGFFLEFVEHFKLYGLL